MFFAIKICTDNMKLLFVCLGNICRSPLGEGIMQSLSDKYQLSLYIDSAGTSAYHVGEAPDSRSIAVAQKNGISIGDQRSRKLSKKDLITFDIIFAMDASNKSKLFAEAPKDTKAKIYLLREFDTISKGSDVPDPYYGGDSGFDDCFQMIYRSCENFLLEEGLLK